jgi:hypothetical protein
MIDYSQKLDKLLNEYNHFVNKVWFQQKNKKP